MTDEELKWAPSPHCKYPESCYVPCRMCLEKDGVIRVASSSHGIGVPVVQEASKTLSLLQRGKIAFVESVSIPTTKLIRGKIVTQD